METVDLEVEQGATFRVQLMYTDENDEPVNLTGRRAHMQIRKRSGTPPLLDLTTENGGIVLGSGGEIDIYIGARGTATLTRKAKYDLHLIDNDNIDEVDRVFGGDVLITPAITVDTA